MRYLRYMTLLRPPWRLLWSHEGRHRSEAGLVMPLLLILMLFGMLLAIPFLGFVGQRVDDARDEVEDEEAYFTADAGIEAVLADLRQGTDALDGPYTLPSVTINGLTAAYRCPGLPEKTLVPSGPVFVDPEIASALSPIAGDSTFEYQMLNVRPFADFQVSWVFTPPDGDWRLKVYEGAGTGGSRLANEQGNHSPARLTVDADEIAGGTYTIEFENKDEDPTLAAPFSPVGDPQATWVRITAFKDYVITSTAGPVTLTVFARQGPGPNQLTSTVHIATWNVLN